VALRNLVPLVAALAMLGACSTASTLRFQPTWQRHGLRLSAGPLPEGATPLGIVFADEVGFYLGGVIPVVRADLESCAGRLVAQALALGADGVANLDIKRFDVSVPLRWGGDWFDWDREIQLKGVAYRAASTGQRARPSAAVQLGGKD